MSQLTEQTFARLLFVLPQSPVTPKADPDATCAEAVARFSIDLKWVNKVSRRIAATNAVDEEVSVGVTKD